MAINGSGKTGVQKDSGASGPDRSGIIQAARKSFGFAENLRGRRALETIMEKIDGSQALNRIGQGVSELVGKVIKPGKLKDFASGTWLGHPVHPMLTDIPIGAWTSSFVLDLMADERVYAASDVLIGMGVAAAVPTAVTGLSDLADVGEDEGLRVGTAHALGNSAAVVCYALSLAARVKGNRRKGIMLSTAGAGFATLGGYLGGHMTYRRGIGVNQTAFQKALEDWTKVAEMQDLQDGDPHMVRLGGDDILLVRRSETVYAVANTCNHRGGPLNEGEVKDGKITCPWHLSTFQLADGSVVRGPATASQPSHETRIVDGQVELRSRR